MTLGMVGILAPAFTIGWLWLGALFAAAAWLTYVRTRESLLPPRPEPDEVAGADITFVRTGAVVHALASVFADVAGARRVWAAVADEGFARCFAESVAHEVELPGHLTLLGPVLPPSDFALDRQGRRLVVHRASFSQAEPDRLLPVELDLAAVLTGRVLVLVWAADEDRATAEPGWRRLVQRLVLRGDVILARDGT